MVLCLAINPRDECAFASGSKDKKIMFWDLGKSKPVAEITAHKGGVGVYGVLMSPA
jgi:WD40 repeat protein